MLAVSVRYSVLQFKNKTTIFSNIPKTVVWTQEYHIDIFRVKWLDSEDGVRKGCRNESRQQ